ncbi:MAG: S24 family peptidase [Acidobacteriota bacterium]
MTGTGSYVQEHSLKCELLCDSLRCFGTLRLKVNGWSMLPTVWPGETIIVSSTNFSQITPGQIALFRRGDRFFVHRVLSKDDLKKEILSRGDAMRRTDPPFVSSELLGEVRFIVRNGKQVEASRKMSWGRRAFAGLMQRSTSAARVAVMTHHLYQSCRPREFSHPCQS